MGKTRQKNITQPPKEICSLSAEKLSSLSNVDYSVYYIVDKSIKIGYLGVFKNGKFNYSIIEDNVDESIFLTFCNSFVQKEFNISPFSSKKRIPIN